MLSITHLTLLSIFLSFLCAIYLIAWRLYWSPLSAFPGPKLAAATHLYELYYELIKGGQFVFKKAELHEKYGPIVRINPWELHVNDPDFYEELYAGGGRKRNKFAYHSKQFGNLGASFATTSHELHRTRRAPLNKFFSKASITRLEPLIQSIIDRLCERLRLYQSEGKPVPLTSAYACVANDVITSYCFAQSNDFVRLSNNFHTDQHEALSRSGATARIAKQIPWMVPLFPRIPRRIMRTMNRTMANLMDFNEELGAHIARIISAHSTSTEKSSTNSHPTIFHEILNSDIPTQEKKFHRLQDEAYSIIGAGTETTAWTWSIATYHILSNPSIHARLRAELLPVFTGTGGRPSWTQLEQIPYVHGVISEALRLSFGVTVHLPRIAPHEVLHFKDWTIAPGIPVGMTSVLIHLNPAIFPDPHTFRPERWIENPRLSRYLVSFSKGSRKCLGMNLAYAELYLGLCYLIMQFPDIKLFDTTKDDVEMVADDFIPRASGRGIWVLMG